MKRSIGAVLATAVAAALGACNPTLPPEQKVSGVVYASPGWDQKTREAYSSAFCKWFPWYRSAIGIDREGLVFHSFRHLFTSYLLNVHGVEERMVSFLVGHQVKSMTGGGATATS